MRRILVALILVTALFPITAMSETDTNGGIVIEEILVSASSAQYNGTDWNGDGDIGSFSDQYIMITNTGTDPLTSLIGYLMTQPMVAAHHVESVGTQP